MLKKQQLEKIIYVNYEACNSALEGGTPRREKVEQKCVLTKQYQV